MRGRDLEREREELSTQRDKFRHAMIDMYTKKKLRKGNKLIILYN